MENTQLSTGIAALYDMEMNNYLMQKSINMLDGEIRKLGMKRRISKPVKKKPSEISSMIFSIGFFIVLAAAVIGVIHGLITEGGFFGKIFGGLWHGIVFAVCSIPIGLVGGIVISILNKIKENHNIEELYKKDCREYEKETEADNIRVQNELKKRNFLIQDRNSLVERKEEARERLASFYDTMQIDKTYRNIVPIGYMYQFLKLGVARSLEGADGLYYLVRQELRNDHFQESLNEISEKLDAVLDRESELYREIAGLNARCKRMVQEEMRQTEILGEISSNSAIAAYNSERIKKELAFQNFMLLYKS